MIIGVPKEVKTDEYRVGLTPNNVAKLIQNNHEVYVESQAGEGSGFPDFLYLEVGAKIAKNAKELYESSELIVKVKEPQAQEYQMLQQKHTLFCYLHLAPVPALTMHLKATKLCAIAYETVSNDNALPLLKPMSDIAGSMAPAVAAHFLSRYEGGAGILMGGAFGVEKAKVLIIGAGNAGYAAAKVAYGIGADVTVINRSENALKRIQQDFADVATVIFSQDTFEKHLFEADVVISTVLIHGGASAPKMITKQMLQKMKDGSVIVDVAIDQGGIAQTSQPTTHTNPTYVEEGVIHYCVANMPGAYPKTATLALSNATMPYVMELANEGVIQALKKNPSLRSGVNLIDGKITNEAIANTVNDKYYDVITILEKV